MTGRHPKPLTKTDLYAQPRGQPASKRAANNSVPASAIVPIASGRSRPGRFQDGHLRIVAIDSKRDNSALYIRRIERPQDGSG
jgi:hypothetical protein